MKTNTTPSYIDAQAVARELLDGADVAYPIYGRIDSERARVTLPDGRVATLSIVFDEDSGIGEWIGRDGKRESHHDDIFGTFAWRGKDSLYGYPAERPREFTGDARVFTRYGQGGDRIDGAVWWQPPADVLEDQQGRESLPALVKMIDSWLSGDWVHVGFYVTIEEDGHEVGSASLHGIEWGLEDPDGTHADYLRGTVGELLDEAGIGSASSVSVARWARDPLEAVARRISLEDPEDGPAERYHAILRELLAWWHERVEPAGDWDAYGENIANRIELDYADHLRAPERSRPGRSMGVSHGEGCPFCLYSAPPYPSPLHHAWTDCPRNANADSEA